jgi:hypothetical protein
MTGSRYMQIEMGPPRASSPTRWLIEIDRDGYIVREIEFDFEGAVIAITRPGEYGMWNDSDLGPRVAPYSDESNRQWASIGAIDVPPGTFETAWLEAEVAKVLRKRRLLGFLRR